MDRFEEIYKRYEDKELSCKTAAELLHCDERTFRRKRDKYLIGGIESVLDKRSALFRSDEWKDFIQKLEETEGRE